MSIYRVQVTFEAASSLPADAMTNTLYFEHGIGIVAWDNLEDLVNDFYGFDPASASFTANYATEAFSGEVQIDVYNLDDPEPRAVAHQWFTEFTPESAETLPAEVALVLSFQGDPESGEPQARRRGRIYTGPYSISNTVAGRPGTALIGELVGAGQALYLAA